MSDYKTYLFTYSFAGACWEFQIVAQTQEEAMQRLAILPRKAGWVSREAVHYPIVSFTVREERP